MNPASPPTAKPNLSERLKALFVEYGRPAIAVYFAIFALVLAGFALAIRLGIELDGVGGSLGTWGAAYVATKLTQPLRIAATLALTPAVVRLLRTKRKASPDEPADVA